MDKIIIASGPVIVENGKVLLDQHGDTDLWKFCGGRKKESNESLIDIAKRRAKEELGIEIEILDKSPFVMYLEREIEGKLFDVVLVHYLAKRLGEIVPGKEIVRWDWIDLKNLPKNLGPNIIPTLKHFDFIQ
jgi:8-oxo-dGTP pyrophosphatase MutT (NUDIX family)